MLHAKSANKAAHEVLIKGSTPLHFAVHMRLWEQVQTLLQAGSDPSLMDEKNQTAYRLARVLNDDKIVWVFQQHRLWSHRLRKSARQLANEAETSRKQLIQYASDTKQLHSVRQTLMAQVVRALVCTRFFCLSFGVFCLQ
jgi:hypothetical protein